MQLEWQNRPTAGRLVHRFQVMLPSCEPYALMLAAQDRRAALSLEARF